MTQQWRFVQESKPIFADFDVAQVSNLLYRRFPIGKARFSEVARRFHALQAGSPAIQQVGNLRYAELKSARLVSPKQPGGSTLCRLEPAIQQVGNLRYAESRSRAEAISGLLEQAGGVEFLRADSQSHGRKWKKGRCFRRGVGRGRDGFALQALTLWDRTAWRWFLLP